MYKDLRATGSAPGILYGLPKIHKKDFSSKFQHRPIFAAYNCAAYKLSKFLVKILTPISQNRYTIRNSASFVEELTSLSGVEAGFMASFDVEDLYTNVPLVETIDICLKNMDHGGEDIMGISKPDFRKMLELSVFNSVFQFNDRYYKQVDGLGMGLPLSPTLANAFLCENEEKWLQECPEEFKPTFYRRYIDDCFLLFRHEFHADKFLEYLNSKHSNIKFTCEKEISKKLPFLDCAIERTNDGFDIGVFRKATFTGLALSFFSFSPLIYKINSIKTLIFRAYKICSNRTNCSKEFNFLRDFFQNNVYPCSVIYSQIQKFIHSKIHHTEKFPTVERKLIYLSLPYFGPKSDNLKEILETMVLRHFPYVKLRIAMVNRFTVASLFHYKDELPTSLRSSVVYCYRCPQCEAGSYIGSTIRLLYQRISEHGGRSFYTGELSKNPVHSAI